MPVDTFFPPLTTATGSRAPDWLVSFDIVKFILFWGLTCGVGYPLYRIVGVRYLRWEAHPKSSAKNFDDMMESFNYILPLFVFGNYSNTINWIIITSYFFGLFFFGWAAEAPFLKHSFADVRVWSVGMGATVAGAVATVVGVLGYHIYLAYQFQFVIVEGSGSGETASILGWYLVGMLVPVALLITGWSVVAAQNGSSNRSGNLDAVAGSGRKWERVSLHVHHWAIFYCVAYFTRFDNVVSNLAAGLCLGSYVHGISAYGHDDFIERIE